MSRWVVCVKPPDDHPAMVRVFGTFADDATASFFCSKVRTAVDLEDGDDDAGYAYVMRIEQAAGNLRRAMRWATRGER